MDARLARKIETGVELLAAALFAGAVGFAVRTGLITVVGQAQALRFAGAAAVAAFFFVAIAVRYCTSSAPRFRPSAFVAVEFEPVESDELILSEGDRVDRQELMLSDADRLVPLSAAEPLVLDDVLAELGPDSRVVRLFDRKAMPTPGQLQSRIDDHLHQSRRPAPQPQDASQALSDALAQLRRSLR